MRDSGIHSFQLGEWRAYPARNLLAGHRGEVHLEPKAMQVLQVLASAPRRVFSRDELNDAVWGGRAVSDGPLTHSIASLRHALGDSPKSPQYIQTIPKRGYRLICDVVALSLSATDEGNYLGVESVRGNKQQRSQRTHFLLISALGLIVVLAVSAFMLFKLTTAQIQPQATLDEVITADRPPWSLAVLPFEVIGDDPDAGYFGDGLTEEILKTVSQMPELQVTGRTS